VAVGLGVGDFVGAPVGLAVGVFVGLGVGEAVGEAVGDLVGASVTFSSTKNCPFFVSPGLNSISKILLSKSLPVPVPPRRPSASVTSMKSTRLVCITEYVPRGSPLKM